MKAKDMYDKYHSKLLGKSETEFNKALSDLFIDLFKETKEIIDKRKIQTDRALLSLIREQNAKYNAFVRLINKSAGRELLKEDGFKTIMYKELNIEGGNENEKSND